MIGDREISDRLKKFWILKKQVKITENNNLMLELCINDILRKIC